MRAAWPATRLRCCARATRPAASNFRSISPTGWRPPSSHAHLRLDLIAAEREHLLKLLRDGKITDESRRRIERELDLEEASIECREGER